MDSKSLDMTKGNLWKQMILFSLPLMLSNFLQVLFNLSDVAIVGKFAGPSSLGAVGSTTILVTLFIGFLIGLGGGINVLCAKYIGSKRYDLLKTQIHNGIIVSFAMGIIILILGFIFTPSLLELLKTKETLIADATVYLRIYLLAMPGVALFNYGNAIYSALGNTKKPLMFLAIAGVANILLNLLFVVVFKMAVKGVALASLIAQYLSMVLVLISLMRRNDFAKLSIKEIKYNAKDTEEILRLGIPAGFQYAVFAIANLFIQSAVNSFEEVVVDGNAAAQNFDGLVYDLMAAIYMAGASFVGQNYGAKDKKRILDAYYISVFYSFLIGTLLGVTLFCFSRQALSIFTSDEEVITQGVKRLEIMGLSYGFSAFMDAPLAASRGLGKAIIPVSIEILGSCVFRIIWVYTVFAYYHTIESLYLVYICSWTITSAGEIIYFVYKFNKVTMDF